MDKVTLILLLVLLSVGLLVYGLREYLRKSFDTYEETAISQMQEGLADNLLFLDPKYLFFITLGLSLFFGVLFFSFYGMVPGLIAAIVVAILPRYILRYLKAKRDEKFVYQLPDCLSTLSMSLKAGSNLSRAMELVVEQQPAPISQEFAIVLSDVKMGQNIDEALSRMYARVNSVEVELFTSAVSISRTVGGNLADTIDTLSDTIRERLQIEGKIKALTAMGRAQGWVVGAMPVLVIYALYQFEPEAMRALTTELIGWIVCAILAILSILAFFMIRKIINIEV